MERMDGELELEVSDLRARQVVESGPIADHLTEAQQNDNREADETSALPMHSVRSSAVGPAPVRRASAILSSRRVRGAAVAAVVLLVCTAVLLTLPGAQQTLRGALFGPTPTPTPPLVHGADTFFFENGVSWGRLTVDGQARGLPAFDKAITLSRGRHTLDYRADPFPPLHCQVSVPAAASDTCPKATGFNFGPTGFSSSDGRLIELGMTLDALPQDQQAALARTIDAALHGTSLIADVSPAITTWARMGHPPLPPHRCERRSPSRSTPTRRGPYPMTRAAGASPCARTP